MNAIIKSIEGGAQSHGGIPFWSWNDRLDTDELRSQIRNMKKIGMEGFFMHARTGLETEYMSDEWFECVAACIDEAKKQGMQAWSYDENGWPSGFAGGKLLEDPKNFAAYVRIGQGAYPAEGDILGVYTLENGELKKVSSDTGAENYITVYRCYDRSYVDTLDAAVIKKFIDSTYEEYRRRTGDDFGGAMPGFFTDEPQYFRWATPWSDTLPALFKQRYGYDISSALPALFIDFVSSDTVSAEEFRYDYYRLIHELFINNYQKQIYDWCEEHGAQITGHAVEETFLAGQMWCCGGVMPFYQYEHIPGMDYLGRGITNDLAPKQLGSVCAQTGRKKVLSEMFACCGWDVSPVELKRIAELQYVGGVNMMCTHLYPYSIRGQRKRDYPAFYSQHLPWQFALEDFDKYFNNLGYTLSLGRETANTLIIHPMHSAYLGYKRSADRASIAELEDKLNEIVDLFS
ncbi:MAG: glycosyl hydrolase, partial [Eubacteriales bacterium]